jgi:hypothetical protein
MNNNLIGRNVRTEYFVISGADGTNKMNKFLDEHQGKIIDVQTNATASSVSALVIYEK